MALVWMALAWLAARRAAWHARRAIALYWWAHALECRSGKAVEGCARGPPDRGGGTWPPFGAAD